MRLHPLFYLLLPALLPAQTAEDIIRQTEAAYAALHHYTDHGVLISPPQRRHIHPAAGHPPGRSALLPDRTVTQNRADTGGIAVHAASAGLAGAAHDRLPARAPGDRGRNRADEQAAFRNGCPYRLLHPPFGYARGAPGGAAREQHRHRSCRGAHDEPSGQCAGFPRFFPVPLRP